MYDLDHINFVLNYNPNERCYNCGQIDELLKCAKCNGASYCGKEYQHTDRVVDHEFFVNYMHHPEVKEESMNLIQHKSNINVQRYKIII